MLFFSPAVSFAFTTASAISHLNDGYVDTAKFPSVDHINTSKFKNDHADTLIRQVRLCYNWLQDNLEKPQFQKNILQNSILNEDTINLLYQKPNFSHILF